jgi:DNA-directed RNA polymerase specialized sigma24 family protein
MRRICVDDARNRGRLKRGGGHAPLQSGGQLAGGPLAGRERSGRERSGGEYSGGELASFDQDPVEVIAVDDALVQLERVAPRQAEVVKLRYFVGLTVDETADILGISPRTVDIEWRYARAWLHRELHDGDTNA